MKCKSCAGNYKTKELICPYCGRANLLGKLWFAEKSEAEKEYEKVQADYKERVTPYVVNRLLNRLIVICFLLIGLCAAGFVVVFLAWGSGHEIYKKGGNTVINHKLESYYAAGDYLGLYNYMSGKDLLCEEQYKYSQAAILAREYAYFQAEKLQFMSLSEEEKAADDNYCLELLLGHASDVCGPQIGIYAEPDPENEEMIANYREEVYAFLYGTFGITDEEWEPFTISSRYPEVDNHELADTLRERRAWNE